jgi:hypothetical protein
MLPSTTAATTTTRSCCSLRRRGWGRRWRTIHACRFSRRRSLGGRTFRRRTFRRRAIFLGIHHRCSNYSNHTEKYGKAHN